ncbi:MAG TPA: alpha/beta hydrolase [Noviherbaspirillum sp.]|jgi:pimeloyl-ACP methyl ester carboxylesterase|uniref:alpha/beta fold hydrolase n=1 Tax=Noviherbaspirillum sp. TaxID=1926288 RepID=UPI002F958048
MSIILTAAAIMAMLVLAGAAGLALFTWWTARRVEAGMPPQGRFVDAAGVRFHVTEQGSGPGVLLIHGLAGQMRHYTYGVASQLAREYRVVAIDRPGSGYSVRDASTPADLSTQAASIASLIDTLQLGPALVTGHSLGGAIALTLAVEHPQHVAGLALVAPLTHPPEDDAPPAAFRALTIASPFLRKVFAWTLAIPGSIAGRHAVLDQVFGPEPVPADFGTRGGGLLGLRPSHFIAASRDLQAVPLRLSAIAARYAELRTPVGILFARGDRILDWRANGDALAAKVQGARLKVVDGGHMLPVTQPDVTADFIRECAEQAFRTSRAT